MRCICNTAYAGMRVVCQIARRSTLHCSSLPHTILSHITCCRSLTSDPKIGDHWASWFRFEVQFGTPETQASVTQQVRYLTLLTLNSAYSSAQLSLSDRPSSLADRLPLLCDHCATNLVLYMTDCVPACLTCMQCVDAEPNRGEVWNRVAKNPKHAHEKLEAILKKVAVEQAAAEKAAGDLRLESRDGAGGAGSSAAVDRMES